MAADPPEPARLAADNYARALTVLRRARDAYTEAHVPLDPVAGIPPNWSPAQHEAIVNYHKAWQGLVIARSAWVAAPKN